MTERKFAWEPWIDPLNRNREDFVLPGEDDALLEGDTEYYDFRDNPHAGNTVQDMDNEFYERLSSEVHSIKPLRVVHTKFGLLTVTESTVANYHFDFWILHSNKEFTADDAEIICKCPGVDAFMAMTRYRVKLGFPKSGLFNLSEVKAGIVEALKEQEVTLTTRPEELFTGELKEEVDSQLANLKAKGGHWLLYVLPNGSMEAFETENINEKYREKLKFYESSQKLVGGHVFKN